MLRATQLTQMKGGTLLASLVPRLLCGEEEREPGAHWLQELTFCLSDNQLKYPGMVTSKKARE